MLDRLRNWQSRMFWSRLFARPLAIALLYPIADLPWVTPNVLTHLGNLNFGAGIAAMWLGHDVAAAVFLQIHLIFDNMDGTLARYRGCETSFGSYYDKISDALGISAMFLSLGWLAFERDPSRPHLIAVGAIIAINQILLGYSKWVTVAAHLKQGTASTSVHQGAVPPPTRTPVQWALWFFDSLARIALFEEADYFLWVGLALILGRLDWVLYLLAAAGTVDLLVTVVRRGIEAAVMDAAERTNLGAGPLPGRTAR